MGCVGAHRPSSTLPVVVSSYHSCPLLCLSLADLSLPLLPTSLPLGARRLTIRTFSSHFTCTPTYLLIYLPRVRLRHVSRDASLHTMALLESSQERRRPPGVPILVYLAALLSTLVEDTRTHTHTHTPLRKSLSLSLSLACTHDQQTFPSAMVCCTKRHGQAPVMGDRFEPGRAGIVATQLKQLQSLGFNRKVKSVGMSDEGSRALLVSMAGFLCPPPPQTAALYLSVPTFPSSIVHAHRPSSGRAAFPGPCRL
ncbi:uncharacterized protein LY79DRAFT_4518 [Colletotrichum navitas]|uniref:Uncharacterized protein n=1 Tax=Colletotrichum navitas TaxID=681940 RepID=A0AAD8VCY9_9PEZI|nr:uncharacterized protein LY79DRAFT_4518 [Colletotrichum navitas]KAK1600035.1 hypothetical protein LY79DRAFT_4518 [Colletotrichum navitas]